MGLIYFIIGLAVGTIITYKILDLTIASLKVKIKSLDSTVILLEAQLAKTGHRVGFSYTVSQVEDK